MLPVYIHSNSSMYALDIVHSPSSALPLCTDPLPLALPEALEGIYCYRHLSNQSANYERHDYPSSTHFPRQDGYQGV